MGNTEFKLITISGAPTLTMRYYKATFPQKGIIIFVHGVSHGAWCWEPFIKFLSQRGYACFALNLRGHGDDKDMRNLKGACLSDYTIDVIRCVNRCKSYCEENKDEITYSKPFLIGHSMGGAIVQKYVSDFSYEVSGAVLLAAVTAGGMKLSGIISSSIFSLSGLCTLPATLGLKKVSALLISHSNFFSNRLKKELAKTYNGLLCKESTKAMFGLKKYNIYTDIDIPILVVGSEADKYFNKKSLVKTAKKYGIEETNENLKIVPDLCHDIMLDPHESETHEVIKYIYNFIAKNTP